FQPYYFLLRKGGTFDLDEISATLTSRPVQTNYYDTPQGTLAFFTINFG
ncbi:hypothetical protein HY492_00160, partial [Candidatus Woesearchaeota archaeon]|nr:hypothetical protein [Candidatus Woesearchaeota archaeon]